MSAGRVLAIVLLAILLLLVCLSFVRVGGDAEYSADGLLVRVRIGPGHIGVYPVKRRAGKSDRKKAGPKKQKTKKAEPEKRSKGGTIALVKEFLPLVGEAAGEMKRRIRIDTLELEFISGGENAAAAAMNFGYANVLFGMMWPIFEQNFDMGEHRFQASVDFNAPHMTLYGKAAFSARIGQLVSFALRIGWKALRIYLHQQKEDKKMKEAI